MDEVGESGWMKGGGEKCRSYSTGGRRDSVEKRKAPTETGEADANMKPSEKKNPEKLPIL